MSENEISKLILDSAIAVHRDWALVCLNQFTKLSWPMNYGSGLRVDRQVPIAIRYKDMIFDAAFRADLVVEEKVLVELKSWNKSAKPIRNRCKPISG